MKAHSLYALLACCSIAAAAVLYSAAHAQTADASNSAPARWEHAALTHDDAAVAGYGKLAAQINQMGDDGWQLVTVSTVVKDGATTKTIFYFKRQK